MSRRKLLEWMARGIGVACALIVGVPAVRYLIDPLRRRPATERGFKRVARLDSLPVGVPREIAVRDTRRDAWTLYPEETIGRVWVLRRDAPEDPAQTQFHVFTTVCPHLGCAIQLDTSGKKFICPCHKAGFQLTGERTGEKELGHKNPAPRNMDAIDHQLARDEGTQEWWLEIRFQKFKQGLTTKVPVS